MAGPNRRGLGRGLGSLIPTAPEVKPDDQHADNSAGPTNSEAADRGPASPGNGAQAGNVDNRSPAGELPDGLAPVDGAYFAELPVDAITPNAVNPRTVFEQEALDELVVSIKEVGLLQPVVVRPLPVDGPEGTAGGRKRYELVMGERRWRATQLAGLETIPAIVRETDDTDMLRDALLENLHRSQLNPLEEAAAYQQLLEDFSCTHEELATRIGRSRPQISNTIRLLKLTPKVQNRVAAGVLSAGHARALLGVDDDEAQDRLAQRVVAEGISVRGLEELLALGEHGGPKRTARPPRLKAPGLTDIAERLSDRLETRVKVDMGKAKGRVTIEYATLADLQRIVGLIDPQSD
ncbi:ParB/RepB/Spo0J family partition protein [Nocardioides sp. Kera G14]|uniref:ParB/RepB/Spo0J family partition protein n=1 Tax=Nocardioides sp. Kera G14 TaxID=2884264 RepID=UPI001D1189FA|nr:ParB/RepB/Spo0J family partition protein [Nocardioides sp. Kera G14]UDY23579.1 ParB/RepB/Spo0J family partition protein [Nocardioides sp. Kera G14]